MLEAPVLCFKIEAVTRLSKWIEDHLRFWMRALVYLRYTLNVKRFVEKCVVEYVGLIRTIGGWMTGNWQVRDCKWDDCV